MPDGQEGDWPWFAAPDGQDGGWSPDGQEGQEGDWWPDGQEGDWPWSGPLDGQDGGSPWSGDWPWSRGGGWLITSLSRAARTAAPSRFRRRTEDRQGAR